MSNEMRGYNSDVKNKGPYPVYYPHVVAPPVCPAFVCHPFAYANTDCYYYQRSLGCTDSKTNVRKEWSAQTPSQMCRGWQSPFDMDTLKAAIQLARPASGEVRRAIEACTFKPREKAFTKLIHVCGRQKESRKALEVFEAMCDYRGVQPNKITYSALITACSNAGDWDLAIQVFYKMKAAAARDPDCRPNQVTYNSIIAASERGRRYDVCLSCFEDMSKSDAKPDRVIFCSAINACQKLGNWTEAEKILAVVHTNSYVATLGIYTTMLEHYASQSNWKAALDLFLTMQKLGQPVDARCCRGLMMALESGNQPEMAYHLIEAMWANGIRIETSVYLAALRIMVPVGMWEEALEVVNNLYERGSKIPAEAVTLLIKNMKSSGKENLAKEVESIAVESGVRLPLDEVSSSKDH